MRRALERITYASAAQVRQQVHHPAHRQAVVEVAVLRQQVKSSSRESTKQRLGGSKSRWGSPNRSFRCNTPDQAVRVRCSCDQGDSRSRLQVCTFRSQIRPTTCVDLPWRCRRSPAFGKGQAGEVCSKAFAAIHATSCFTSQHRTLPTSHDLVRPAGIEPATWPSEGRMISTSPRSRRWAFDCSRCAAGRAGSRACGQGAPWRLAIIDRLCPGLPPLQAMPARLTRGFHERRQANRPA